MMFNLSHEQPNKIFDIFNSAGNDCLESTSGLFIAENLPKEFDGIQLCLFNAVESPSGKGPAVHRLCFKRKVVMSSKAAEKPQVIMTHNNTAARAVGTHSQAPRIVDILGPL